MDSPPPVPRHVLITGASTGIGKACALYLAEHGFTAIAAARKLEDAKNLESTAGPNLRPIQLDIADDASISAAAKKIAEITANAGLAGIVNNAGISVPGPVEFIPRDGWRKQFEVNVFGHVAVTQSLLPLLRKHVAQAGPGSSRIIFIGSIAGRVTMPILSAYAASKHAIAAIAGALRMELAAQGIHVCLIEPGAIQSEIWRKGDEVASGIPADDPARELYGKQIDAVVRTSRDSAKNAIPADRVAKLVHRCMTTPNPPRRKTVGCDAFSAATMKKILPEKWFDAILLNRLKIG
jgi:NAD(P)-dependent dehydrogenase (short-subunit alcohol dehydrogenase family)